MQIRRIAISPVYFDKGFVLAIYPAEKLLPAVDIARKYVREKTDSAPTLDFVLFIDADPKTATAFLSDEGQFVRSVDRPAALVE